MCRPGIQVKKVKEEKLQRINELAKKSREEGLNDAEKDEQASLRKEYIEAYKKSLVSQLENTYIVDENGNKRKVQKKKEK